MFNREYIFKRFIFHCYVTLRECKGFQVKRLDVSIYELSRNANDAKNDP